MSDYFKPYEGKRPYLFISYSHRDSEAVLGTISLLNDRKLRLWYDEGIPAGSDWPKNIEQHMQSCAMVLFFASESAFASANCYSEIKTAIALKKTVLVLSLDQTQPPEAWRTLLLSCAELSPSSDPNRRAETVLSCRQVTRSFYRNPFDSFRFDGILLALSLLLLCASGAGLAALMTGRLDAMLFGAATPAPTRIAVQTATPTPLPEKTPEPTPMPYIPSMEKVVFPDALQERAVRSALNRPDGEVTLSDLGGMEELHVCGTMVLTDLSGVAYIDGAYTVNGAKPLAGPIADLSVIGRMPHLKRLSLLAQQVRSLAALNRLMLLEELNLSGNETVDLSSLPVLPSLRILHLEHSSVTDLNSLLQQPALTTVTVSGDMLPLIFPDDAAFDVVLAP